MALGEMFIFVNLVRPETLTLRVDRSNTVGEVKAVIEKHTGPYVAAVSQHAFFSIGDFY